MSSQPTRYRLSGHEGFSCRYTWLPKAVRGLTANPHLFTDEEKAMVTLGVGKNMVRSIRFWSQAAGFANSATKGGGISPTNLGNALLGEDGLDPFLESAQTLWLIHWHLSTELENPLLAWDYLLNRWQEPEVTRSSVLKALQVEVERTETGGSQSTIEQHLETFLHTYIPTRGKKGEIQEDNLDSPLVELELLVKVGEREIDSASGRRETIYAFRREEKEEITPELFLYCLNDFWSKRHSSGNTLSFAQIASGHGSPGQILKLPEDDIRSRVEKLEQQTKGIFTYVESSNIQQLQRSQPLDSMSLLKSIYTLEEAYA